MERNMSIKRRREEIGSCNSCGARSYKGMLGDLDGVKTDAVLVELKIGCMVMCLCESCLKELIGAATVVLAKMDLEG